MAPDHSSTDYLDETEQARLHSLRQSNPFVADALTEVARILASQTFKRVKLHARDFLSFIVARKLLGQERQLKEKSIAIRVFHEPADYNPAESSPKVRVAAKSLRDKLREYFASEGRTDPIEITIPNFSYVPTIEDRRISIGIRRIENWNPDHKDTLLSAVIRDEIIGELAKTEVIRVATAGNRSAGIPPFRYALRCSLETLDDYLHLHVSISDLTVKRIVAAETFKAQREDVLRLSQQVANAISALIPRADTAKVVNSPRRRPAARETAHRGQRRCLAPR